MRVPIRKTIRFRFLRFASKYSLQNRTNLQLEIMVSVCFDSRQNFLFDSSVFMVPVHVRVQVHIYPAMQHKHDHELWNMYEYMNMYSTCTCICMYIKYAQIYTFFYFPKSTIRGRKQWVSGGPM
jgi:hypothetical protein